MIKRELVEEMAQIINGSTELDTIAYYRCMKIAKTIYNAGYRKLPEDSVVLSREDYKRLLDNAIRVDNDLSRDALNIITEQEKEIEQLTRECNQQADVGRLNLARKLKGNGYGNRKSERD